MVPKDHGIELARATSQRMVLYLNRSGGQSQFSERRMEISEVDDDIDRLLADIANNPAASLTNARLADRLCVSERHLARVFKARTGTTPARWLERVRVDVARRHLETSAEAIEVVGLKSGFSSLATFRQAFSRVMDMTPSQYRQRHRGINV